MYRKRDASAKLLFCLSKGYFFVLVAVSLSVAFGKKKDNNNDTNSFSRLGTIQTKDVRD